MYKHVNLTIDESKRKQIEPLLIRDGLTLSSFLRKCMDDYLEVKHPHDIVVQLDDLGNLR